MSPSDKIQSVTGSTDQLDVKQVGTLRCSDCDDCCARHENNSKHIFQPKGSTLTIAADNLSQMLFLLTGELVISYETNRQYTLTAGHMALIVSGYEHLIRVTEDSEFMIIRTSGTIQICDAISAKAVQEILAKADYTDTILPIYPQMERFLDSVKGYIADKVYCTYLFRAKYMEISIVFRTYYSLEQIVQFFHTILEGKSYFRSQVLANYRKAKNVTQLAQLCGYGLSNFKQLFKQYFGQPPYQWMLETRAHEIGEALRNKEIPIKMVASQFNFTDQSHLNAYCKKYLGATPRQIRER